MKEIIYKITEEICRKRCSLTTCAGCHTDEVLKIAGGYLQTKITSDPETWPPADRTVFVKRDEIMLVTKFHYNKVGVFISYDSLLCAVITDFDTWQFIPGVE